jgi:D-beta-D-heptose 7-phosphate kinase/D-beta-D-heptose 1-phosphate adenosyltransferase
MARQQQVVRFDHERDDDLPQAAIDEICRHIRESVRDSDVLVLEDYNKGVLTPEVIRTAISTARAGGIPIVVDPKFRNIFAYRGATVFKPNAHELSSALAAPIEPLNDEWLERARMQFDCEHLLVTLGEDGMVVRSRDRSTLRIPAVAREVYDVSGAGDTVTAFVAVALGAGAEVHDAAQIANFAAALEVAKPGVATVSPGELREMVELYREQTVAPLHG